MSSSNVVEAAKEVKERRDILQNWKEVKRTLQQQLEELDIYITIQAVSDTIKEIEETVLDAENILRQAALEEYQQTGKKTTPIYTIRSTKKFNYDQIKALHWLIDMRAAKALKIDVAKFKALAKQLEPDFVEIIEENEVAIASNLEVE